MMSDARDVGDIHQSIHFGCGDDHEGNRIDDRAIRFYEKWGLEIAGDKVFVLGGETQRDLAMVRGLETGVRGSG